MSEFDKAVKAIELAYDARDEIVLCLIGPVGIGKTQACKAAAAKRGANVVEIILSQVLPTEISGITMPDNETKSMQIYDHFRLSSLKDGDILFFDELLEADQSVLSACLTLIQERTLMSGKKLPDIQIVAACNPTVSPQILKASIKQRFMFYEMNLDPGDVVMYLEEKYGFPCTQIANYLKDDRKQTYNFLSPRSADKLLYWLSKHPTMDMAKMLDDMFSTGTLFQGLLVGMGKLNDIHKVLEHCRRQYATAKLADCKTLQDVVNTCRDNPELSHVLEELKSVSLEDVRERIEDAETTED